MKRIVYAIVSMFPLCLASAASVSYTYDATGHLTKIDYGNGSALTYTYDNAGNLITRAVATTLTPQTISFAALPSLPFSAAPFTVSATATSGLPVSFNSQTTPVCTASGTNGTTVTLVSMGTCTIQATQAGNANYASATPVNQSFQVTSVPQLIVTKSLSRMSGAISVVVTVTNNGGSAAGSVQLTVAKIGTSLTTTTLPATVGTGTIAAGGGSAQVTVSFPSSVGTTGTATTLTLGGTYTGGSFASTARITLP
jgi:YD repeat-containing protein